MRYNTILFDMDGVLIDSEQVIITCCLEILKEYNVVAKREDFNDFYGMGEDMFIGGVAKKHGAEYLIEMKDKTYDLYGKRVKEILGKEREILKMLEILKKKGFKLAVASSADRGKVNVNLDCIGAYDGLFDAVITGSDIVNKKPDPEIYIKAYKAVGADPKSCVIVEDAPSGLLAAKAADITSIGVTSNFSKERLEEINPDYIVSKTPDIIELLDMLNK